MNRPACLISVLSAVMERRAWGRSYVDNRAAYRRKLGTLVASSWSWFSGPPTTRAGDDRPALLSDCKRLGRRLYGNKV